MTRIETVVLDMAGTTVVDDGLVLGAFERAWDRLGAGGVDRAAAIDHVVATMGQSKIEVFRGLVDEASAQALNGLFEHALAEGVAEGRVTPIPRARETIQGLLDAGRQVVLTTGFSPATAEAVLESLGWEGLVPVLTPADAGRGRPSPDLNLLAALRTGVSAVAALATVGDTESDARAGVNAGAGLVVAVRTGGVSPDALRAAGAAFVLDSVADLPALLARWER